MAQQNQPARNALAKSQSPYLLQHAGNPVDWKEWGEEAFAEAKRRDAPIFLSIGYSTCHWCHVMARESFENEEIGAALNERFVNVKVDREERPDVDRLYMAYVQSLSGSGGWPMSVWLTPDRKPFYGGTYFPPEDRYGRIGFLKLIERIGKLWQEDLDTILQHGEQSLELLAGSASQDLGEGVGEAAGAIDLCFEQLEAEFDEEWGGFGSAPKFPMPAYLQLLIEGITRRGNARLTEMLVKTLERMASGGMFDHVGGGFHRYSVDRYWHVPHYEKMLYDQGQLALAYAEGFRLTGRESFRRVARGIVDYVARELQGKEGQLFAAEDADSPLPDDPSRHGEGAFYVWSKRELDTLLGGDAALFAAAFEVKEAGNARPESDPHGELSGLNTLMRIKSDAELAKAFELKESEVRTKLDQGLARLFEARSLRPRPHLDDKAIVAWNALMITGACRVYQACGYEPAYELAARCGAFLWTRMWGAEAKAFKRAFREGCGRLNGFAEDYAAAANAFLDLYECDFEGKWFARARQVQEQLCKRFLDTERGGFYATEADETSVLVRMRDDYDGAEPSASSLAALALLRMASALDDVELRDLGRRTIEAFGAQWKRAPRAMPLMLVAASRFLERDQQIVVVGKKGDERCEALLAAANRWRPPYGTLLFLDTDGEESGLEMGNEHLEAMKRSVPDGEVRAFVCEDFACKEPVASVEALESLLR